MFPAKLRIVDGTNTHFFSSPEDTWTWLHAKRLATKTMDSQDTDRWLSPKAQRRRSKRIPRGPSASQSRGERDRALETVSIIAQNRFSPLRSDPDTLLDSDSTTTMCSVGMDDQRPKLTPRSADDLG